MATTADTAAAARRRDPDDLVQVVEEALLRPGAPLMYRVDEVVALTRLNRSMISEQLRGGRLRSVRQGRSRLIPAAAVLEYVRLLEREAGGSGAN